VTHRPVDDHPNRPGLSLGEGNVVPITFRRTRSDSLHSDSSASDKGDGSFTIDCGECAHRDTSVCEDCVVSFVVGREPEDALVVDADEARAVRLLERAGLLPGIRHEAQASGL